uniref:DUF1639 domain-containing protein n=1 Tax=Araucaria cunninghamii TaxID=56994 RepID=A0A0D6QVY0_ARACU
MRYQGASPAFMPASNGKKTNVKVCKKEESHENGRIVNGSHPRSLLEGKAVRLKGASSMISNGNHHKELEYFNSSLEQSQEKISEDGKCSQDNQASKKRAVEGAGAGAGDLIFQWGQNKRSRGYRAEYHKNAVEESPIQSGKIIRIDRRSGRHEKQIVASQNPSAVHSKTTTIRPCTPVHDPSHPGFSHRNSEERSATGNGENLGNNGFLSESRGFHQKTNMHAPKSPEKADKVVPGSLQTSCGLGVGNCIAHESAPSEVEAFAPSEKVDLDNFEWPRIYTSLSRKEKEDDFMVMKGSKLPQRPKKRPKNVEKMLQYCFPGNWLSEINKARYEVREKKCVKKKPRGLKAMESLDSDSD